KQEAPPEAGGREFRSGSRDISVSGKSAPGLEIPVEAASTGDRDRVASVLALWLGHGRVAAHGTAFLLDGLQVDLLAVDHPVEGATVASGGVGGAGDVEAVLGQQVDEVLALEVP